MSTPQDLAAVASERLLVLEHSLFDALEEQWGAAEGKVRAGVMRRWRSKSLLGGSMQAFVVEQAASVAADSLEMVDLFLDEAADVSWASLVNELKWCEARLPRKYRGVAGTALNAVPRSDALSAASEEFGTAVEEMLKVVADRVNDLAVSLANEKPSKAGGDVVRALWPSCVAWLKRDARRVEFELVNATRTKAMEEFNAAADRR
jgi:hypothetical protein